MHWSVYEWVILLWFQYSDYIASDGRVIDEWWIGKDLGGSSHSVIELLSWNFLGGTEENYRNLNHDALCPGRDLNQTPPEYKSGMLLLGQSVRCIYNEVCFSDQQCESGVDIHLFRDCVLPSAGAGVMSDNSLFYLYYHMFRGVTVDRVWIGEWIYWPLVHTAWNYK
jgi:hypothetical protein